MTTLQDLSLPPQARAAYKLLLAENGLTANQIGKKLGIFPNAVYRSLETLKKFGCVTEQDIYPAIYIAVAPPEAVERFLLLSREGFLSTFSKSEQAQTEELKINFIKDRDALLKKYVVDAKTATREIGLIISGHELPNDVYFENLKAIRRGVKIKIIVQRYDQANKSVINSWQECGVEVRYLEAVNVRLVVIDHKIVHLLSYDQKEGLSGLGVKVDYPPFAEMLSNVFDNKWQEAQPIAKSCPIY
jgi:sugar-specific transcriptional regulator TrmB